MVKKIEVPEAVHREGKLWREDINSALDEFTDILKDKKLLEVK